jgi:hypothetical protein
LCPSLDQVNEIAAQHAVCELEPVSWPVVAVGLPLLMCTGGKILDFCWRWSHAWGYPAETSQGSHRCGL